MKSSQCLKTVCLLLTLGSLLLAIVSAQNCNRCMENNVACVNSTHFKYCINSSPVSNDTLYCGEGKICTSYDVICISEDGPIKPACSPTEVDCRSCEDTSELFVCTSRTTFQMCSNGTMQSQVNTCPTDTVCSIDSGEFCVKECKLTDGKYECDKVAP